MIVLGIESATDTVGAALRSDDGTRAACTLTGRRRHAESLAPAIAEVMRRADTSLRALDAIAVDVGPGLFTGLRVGVATAKGLAQGLGIGLLGVSSLEVLAAAAFDAGWPGTVLAVVDGRRGEVFCAHYGRGVGPNAVEERSAPTRLRPELVGNTIAGAELPVLACGDGALRYRELLAGAERLSVAGESLGFPDPGVLAALARSRLAAGAALVAPADLQPRYLRDADARINWVQRDAAAAPGV